MRWNRYGWLAGIGAAAVAAIGLAVAGCSTTQPGASGAAAGATRPAGAQLWAQNCGHCHNIRSPSSQSDAQWEVVMLHMRVRANLTAEEHKAILAFLKSSH